MTILAFVVWVTAAFSPAGDYLGAYATDTKEICELAAEYAHANYPQLVVLPCQPVGVGSGIGAVPFVPEVETP